MRLSRLQRWMQAVVVHPGTTEEALRSRGAALHLNPGNLESVLLPSPSLTAAQRIAVYQEMFPIRMREALTADYPGLEHFLGDSFGDFVAAYTRAHPSMGYTLNRLGDSVPAFLGRQTKLKPRGFLQDLARLELAITEAFDSKEMTRLRAEDLETIRPESLGRSRLVTVPSLRLIDLTWNAGDYLDTIRDEKHAHPSPRRASSWVAVVRREYSVYRLPLTRPGFLVLQDLQSGRAIATVVRRALARPGRGRATPEDFTAWFRQWTAEGVFSAIQRAVTKRAPRKQPKRS